nr:hypothetical protein [uncultured Anaeromusa sp.]
MADTTNQPTGGTPQDFYGSAAVISDADKAAVTIQSNGVQVQAGTSQEDQATAKATEEAAKQETNVDPENPNDGDETSTEEQQTDPPEVDPAVQSLQNQQQAAAALEKDLTAKGVDFKALEAEYEAKGAFSPESLETLEKAGYPKSVVDAYLRGLQADGEVYRTKVLGFAGGDEAEYKSLLTEIAKRGPKYAEAYDKVINSGDLATIELMLDAAKGSRVVTKGTVKPSVLGTGSGAPQGGPKPFATEAEMCAAIDDRRYREDKGYREAVRARVQVTPFSFQ